MYLFSLTEKLDDLDFGGKASGLSNIISLGLLSPKGYAVKKEAYKYFLSNKKLPINLLNDLEKIIPEISEDKVIVRSSAIGEDADDYSFAGQLDSFVTDNNIHSVCEGIIKCWDSLNSERVNAYQDISGKKINEMGVVIQNFIKADYAGVLFTQSLNSKNNTYCEYVKGGSEPLVSGKVTPKSFSTNTNLTIIGNNNLPFDYKILIRDAMILKENFEKELDIEWLYSKGKFYFVQARPIKVLDKSKTYWTNTNLNENYPGPISPLLYSIARDSYYHYFKNLSELLLIKKESIHKLENDFSNIVGIFGNRIYYNMTSIHNVFAASPYQSYFKDAFNKFVGYQDNNASSKEFVKKTSVFKIGLKLLRLNIFLNSHTIQIENKVDRFAKNVSDAKGIKELALCFSEFLDLRFHQWYHASLSDFFSMLHYKLLGNLTKRIYGTEHIGIHNTLIQAIKNLPGNKPLFLSWNILHEILKIPGGKDFFTKNDSKFILDHIEQSLEWQKVHNLIQQYMKNWGFRCSGELMFTTENYIELPWKFIEILQSYIQCEKENPDIALAMLDSERRKLLIKSTLKIFRKRHILFPLALFEVSALLTLTNLCRKAILCRERVRYKQAQMYYNFKKTIFQIGDIFKEKGILAHQKDILFLDYKEIGNLLSSSDMFVNIYSEIISIRKSEYEKNSSLQFPTSFETIFGEQVDPIKEKIFEKTEGKEFYGLAASGGKKRANVKVLESVLEAKKIQKGEILVTKQTDPGWALVFPIIGGLIVEKGGALSHGAIVAREFGIPAVLGIDNITEILNDNDEVVLDGDIGKIQIL